MTPSPPKVAGEGTTNCLVHGTGFARQAKTGEVSIANSPRAPRPVIDELSLDPAANIAAAASLAQVVVTRLAQSAEIAQAADDCGGFSTFYDERAS